MIQPSYFFRNARAGELLELFFISALVSLLGTRFYLYLLHYPSIGGGRLHIAHLVPGGILMMTALIVSFAFIGNRIHRLASILGGLGCGLFLDEIGKFITRDNNYFYQPTVALIYLIFMILFIIFRSLSGRRHLSPRENLLNALMLIEEVVINDLDAVERSQVLTYLHHADQAHPLVKPLTSLMQQARPEVSPGRSRLRQAGRDLESLYRRYITSRFGVIALELVFVAKVAIFLIALGGGLVAVLHHAFAQRLVTAYILQTVSSIVSATLVFVGIATMPRSRLAAYEWFHRSLLVDIFVTEFFAFYRHQFGALPGFTLNVLLYVGLGFIMRGEAQHRAKSA